MYISLIGHILEGKFNKMDIATRLGHCNHKFWYEMFKYLSNSNSKHIFLTSEDGVDQQI